MNHSGEKGTIDSASYVMDEEDSEQFNDIQELLGTLLLALNWPVWADEDRAILLRCIDCLERKLIDIKQGGNYENPAAGIADQR